VILVHRERFGPKNLKMKGQDEETSSMPSGKDYVQSCDNARELANLLPRPAAQFRYRLHQADGTQETGLPALVDLAGANG
jgi:hypothetical protein